MARWEKAAEELIERVILIKSGRHARKTALGSTHLLKRTNTNNGWARFFNQTREVRQAAYECIGTCVGDCCGRGYLKEDAYGEKVN